VRWRKTWEGFSFPVKNLRDLGDFRWGGEDGGGACQPRQRPWVATRHNRSEAEARQAGRRTGQRKGGCGGAVPFFLPAPRPRRMVALVPLPSRSSVAFPPAAAVRLWAVGRCAGDGGGGGGVLPGRDVCGWATGRAVVVVDAGRGRGWPLQLLLGARAVRVGARRWPGGP
jgi:hypothetical protein